MSKYLEKYDLPKLNQEEIENLNVLKPFKKLNSFFKSYKEHLSPRWLPS